MPIDDADADKIAKRVVQLTPPGGIPVPRRRANMAEEGEASSAPQASRKKIEWTKIGVMTTVATLAAGAIAFAAGAAADAKKAIELEPRLRVVETAAAVNTAEHKAMMDKLETIIVLVKKDKKTNGDTP